MIGVKCIMGLIPYWPASHQCWHSDRCTTRSHPLIHPSKQTQILLRETHTQTAWDTTRHTESVQTGFSCGVHVALLHLNRNHILGKMFTGKGCFNYVYVNPQTMTNLSQQEQQPPHFGWSRCYRQSSDTELPGLPGFQSGPTIGICMFK